MILGSSMQQQEVSIKVESGSPRIGKAMDDKGLMQSAYAATGSCCTMPQA
jgi:hypothetical protein